MSKRIRVRHFWNHTRYYASYLLLALYIIVAFLFLFTNTWIDFIPSYRITIGVTFLVFSALRFYVAYTRFNRKKELLKGILSKTTNNNEIAK
jgi:hypothetical protein